MSYLVSIEEDKSRLLPVLHPSKFMEVYPTYTNHSLNQWNFYANEIAKVQRNADKKQIIKELSRLLKLATENGPSLHTLVKNLLKEIG